MRVVLGVNTAFAVKRWPRVDDWAPVVAGLPAEVPVQVCLDLVDLSSTASARRAAAHHASVLRAYSLAADSTFTGLNAYSTNLLLSPERPARDRAQRWFERAIDFTAAIGGRGTGGHVGAFSVPDWSSPPRRDSLWQELRGRLAVLAERSREAGLSFFAIENLASVREPGTIAQIEELLGDGDSARVPIQVCIDIGHQCIPGTTGADSDPYAWLEHFATRACAIHLQQNDGTDRHWPFTADRNSEGLIRADKVLAALDAGGAASATLMLEITEPPREPDDAVVAHVSESIAYWRAAIEAHPGIGRSQPEEAERRVAAQA